ncbi:hypothetical protein [Promicromonospora sp. NPDC057488]|uniref:hypothetical protein n=1 Tax=Promicromonospora sp. NPDC057488 TaxID=3346147 RepID=UPI003671FA70
MNRPTMLEGPYGLHWQTMSRLVQYYAVGDEWDPLRLWGLPASGDPEPLPKVGPAVYTAVSSDRCFWVGQTQNLHDRFTSHMAIPYRRHRWLYVGAMVLKPDTPAAIVNRLETETAQRLRPADGKAWPQAA